MELETREYLVSEKFDRAVDVVSVALMIFVGFYIGGHVIAWIWRSI